MVSTRRREQKTLWSVCTTHGPGEGGGVNGDWWWMMETPMNPVVRSVSCRGCGKSIDLKRKN